ncbi:MAG: hypothetical protein JOZ72_08765 [Alphaproteobacteria bacterium]|nr:hypothetical protein [Alphaproteobacteria bacterium]
MRAVILAAALVLAAGQAWAEGGPAAAGQASAPGQPPAAAPASDSADPCAPLHAALAKLYHMPQRRHSTLKPESGPPGTTDYVLTADRQYIRFPNSTGWMATPLGEEDRAAMDAGLQGLTARDGTACTAAGEETVDGKKVLAFTIDDPKAHSKIHYWVAAGLVIKGVHDLAYGSSLTDTYEYDDVKAPQ